jgi:hypothetical protein
MKRRYLYKKKSFSKCDSVSLWANEKCGRGRYYLARTHILHEIHSIPTTSTPSESTRSTIGIPSSNDIP